MYNIILLYLIIQKNYENVIIFITNTWMGYIIHGYAIKNKLIASNEQVLKKLKDNFKKVKEIFQLLKLYITGVTTDITIFFNDTITYINLLNKLKYHYLYLYFEEKILEYKGILSVLNSMCTTLQTIIYQAINIFFMYTQLNKEGDKTMKLILPICLIIVFWYMRTIIKLNFKNNKLEEKIKEIDSMNLNEKDKSTKIKELKQENYENNIEYLTKRIKRLIIIVVISLGICYLINYNDEKQGQLKIEQLKIEQLKQKEKEHIDKFNDIYVMFLQQSFENISDDKIDYIDYTIKITKNENEHSITYELIDNTTKKVVIDKVKKY